MASAATPSPGEAYSSPGVPPMTLPHLDFIYRIVCEMDPGTTTIAGVRTAGVDRLVLPIAGGVVRGPRVNGIVVPNSGADWAQLVHGEKVAIRLDARYTLQTDDGHFLLVTAKGMYRQGPGPVDPDASTRPTVGQDRVEYFTHLSFEAPGTSPYGWMNYIVALGVMTVWEDRPVIDCYRLTNFPGVEAEN